MTTIISSSLWNTVQSRFSDIKFSDNLWFKDQLIAFSDFMLQFSDSFIGDQKRY